MEENDNHNSIKDLIANNLLIFSLILAGVVLLGIGLVQYVSSSGNKEEAQFVKGGEAKISEAESSSTKVTVDIAGQVQNPGVYTLPSDARLSDAITAAGGLNSNADNEYISKNLNLAQKVIDGGKIYIPAVGEESQNLGSNLGQDTSVMGTANQNSSLININSASEASLDTLPKVGPVTAKKIISARPYSTIEELVSKKVLTQKTFDGLKDLIMVQ